MQAPPTPVSEWLVSSRKSKGWTVRVLLDRMAAEIEWAPAASNYSRYETAKQTPLPDTLAKFVAFWAGHGVAGPDLTPKPAPVPPPDLASAVVALTAQLASPMASSGEATSQPEFAALLSRIDGLVAQLALERAERQRWEKGWIATLRAALAGQVPAELLDALVPPPPGDIQP